MSEKPNMLGKKGDTPFSREIGAQEKRKLKARRELQKISLVRVRHDRTYRLVSGGADFAGRSIGIWLDKRYAGNHSWTLTMLVIGLVIGCLNAWHWVTKESKEMHNDEEDNNE